jgi:hypothetical protein
VHAAGRSRRDQVSRSQVPQYAFRIDERAQRVKTHRRIVVFCLDARMHRIPIALQHLLYERQPVAKTRQLCSTQKRACQQYRYAQILGAREQGFGVGLHVNPVVRACRVPPAPVP